jgi:hypothetical protein
MHVARPLVPTLDAALAPAGLKVDVEALLAAALAELAAARKRRAEAEAARTAAAEDPAIVLVETKLAAARELRAAKLAEHELATDVIYRDACLARGDEMVARLYFDAGSVVMRAETAEEGEKRDRDIAAHQRAADKATDATTRASCLHNAEETAREAIRACILSDMDHFETLTEKHPAAWGELGRCRNALVSGRAGIEGKGGGR